MMNTGDQQFLHTLAEQLDKTIRKLLVDENVLTSKIGTRRVEELRVFWKQDLSAEEELDFKNTLDYWDKELLKTWARSKRAHHTRASVAQSLLKLNSGNSIKSYSLL
ncbi:conserved hypothetical protein [Crenothrix polyspora]|uniref:Uncharacterized protein n=2 Tax=Crenothrix polyspora TaxID=360316 RepID=A0A1R4H9U0_9GAMM|nr:conserved hypothetical protein [Crenothrix polyspora]